MAESVELRVRLLETVELEIAGHGAAALPEIACGLLLGTRHDDRRVVTRALRCLNTAGDDHRTELFVIDPGAILNVHRSLQRTPLSILGFYYVPADGQGEPTSLDECVMSHWTGMLWLIAPAAAGGSGPRAWWNPPGSGVPREVAIESVAPTPIVSCPE